MLKYFKALGRNNQPNDFRVILLEDESMLIVRHLTWLSEKDYSMDESIIRDHYQIADFLRKGEYSIWKWQEIGVEEYELYHQFWLKMYPSFLLSSSLGSGKSQAATTRGKDRTRNKKEDI